MPYLSICQRRLLWMLTMRQYSLHIFILNMADIFWHVFNPAITPNSQSWEHNAPKLKGSQNWSHSFVHIACVSWSLNARHSWLWLCLSIRVIKILIKAFSIVTLMLTVSIECIHGLCAMSTQLSEFSMMAWLTSC